MPIDTIFGLIVALAAMLARPDNWLGGWIGLVAVVSLDWLGYFRLLARLGCSH